jgi:hypothetical protein
VAVALALALPAGGAFAEGRPADASEAARYAPAVRSYVEAARDYLALGYPAEAVRLADAALALSYQSSDARYLRAVLAKASGEPAWFVEELLAEAFASSTFELYRRDDAEILYASVLVETRRPDQALRFIQAKPRDAATLFIEARARMALGDRSGARSAVERSMRAEPFDPRALIAWLKLGEPSASDPADAALVAKAFDSLDSLRDIEPGLVLALVPYAYDAGEARLLLREYRANGGSDPLASVLALEYGLLSPSSAVAELFAAGFIASEDIRELWRLLPDDDARADFLRAFASYGGLVYDDANRDGVPDAFTRYEAGLPVAYALDADQDGRPELSAAFKAGEPSAVELVAGSAQAAIDYGRWPFALAVLMADARSSRRYQFGPVAYRYEALIFEPFGEGPRPAAAPRPALIRPSGLAFPAERALSGAAFRVEEKAGSTVLNATLDDGLPVGLHWIDAGGSRGYRRYEDGRPRIEEIDADGDGRVEARKRWPSPGSSAAPLLEVDTNGDGLFDYRETLAAPFLRSWDLDGDGAPDFTIEELPDGRERRGLSPSWRDAPPLAAYYRDGRLVELRVGGESKGLIADAGGRVRWIGRKPFDLGPNPPPPGSYHRDGLRYALIRVGDEYLAEILTD